MTAPPGGDETLTELMRRVTEEARREIKAAFRRGAGLPEISAGRSALVATTETKE